MVAILLLHNGKVNSKFLGKSVMARSVALALIQSCYGHGFWLLEVLYKHNTKCEAYIFHALQILTILATLTIIYYVGNYTFHQSDIEMYGAIIGGIYILLYIVLTSATAKR